MYNGSPGQQNGHRKPLDPEDYQQNGDFNYFQEEEDYADEQDAYTDEQEVYSQEEQDDDIYYQDNEAYNYPQRQPVYSPPHQDDEEPPSLSPRHLAPEGMEDMARNKESLVREELGYPLGEEESAMDGEDAALDLAELEQLQEEAERMKGLGNKHMAAQVSFIILVWANENVMGSLLSYYKCPEMLVNLPDLLGCYVEL
jgi:hypothetical protein